MKNAKVWYRILLAVMILMTVLIVYNSFKTMGPLVVKAVSDLLGYTSNSLFNTAVVILLIYCIKTVFMVIPLSILYISAGIIFPVFYAILITYIGLFLEMTLGYTIGRYLGKNKMSQILQKNKYTSSLLKFENDNSIFSSFLVRIIKGPPVDITSMFMGSTGIAYSHYIAGSLMGLTPGMILIVLLGRAADHPISPDFIIPLLIYLVLIIITIVIFKSKMK